MSWRCAALKNVSPPINNAAGCCCAIWEKAEPISSSVDALWVCSVMLSDRSAASTSRVIDASSGFFGLIRTAILLALGTKGNKSSSRFATICVAKKATPVTLPSGRTDTLDQADLQRVVTNDKHDRDG